MSTILTDDERNQIIDSMGWSLDGQERGDMHRLIQAVLAKLAQQEPVAWWYMRDVEQGISFSPDQDPNKDWQPLYTRPAPQQADRQRVPGVYVPVPRELLEQVSASLGGFVSDQGWAQADMDTTDSIDALLAAAPEAPAQEGEQ